MAEEQQLYSISNTDSTQPATISPASGPTSIDAQEKWETTNVVEFWEAINSIVIGSVAASPVLIGIGLSELQEQVKAAPGGNPTPTVEPQSNPGDQESPGPVNSSMKAEVKEGEQKSEKTKEEIFAENKETPVAIPLTENDTSGADPVNLFTGNFEITETDLEIPQSMMGLHLTRTYRSGDPVYTPFGWNWDHNHNVFLREFTDDSNPSNVARWNGRLHEDIFRRLTGGDYQPPRGVFEVLEKVDSNHFIIHGQGGITWDFDRTGISDLLNRIPLKTITDKFGNTLTYEYETGGDGWARVKSVKSDSDSRFLNFFYGACDMLERVEDRFDDGSLNGELLRYVKYYHDPDVEHLIKVYFFDANNVQDGDSKEYIFEDVSLNFELRHNIRFVADGKRRIYLENVYEKNSAHRNYNKVVEQRFGEYVYQFDYENLQFVPPPDLYNPSDPTRLTIPDCPSRRAYMMAPDKAISIYTFNYRGDLLDHRMQIIRAGELQSVISINAYDMEGNNIRSELYRGDALWNIVETEYDYVKDDDSEDPRFRGLPTKVTITGTGATPRVVWEATYDESLSPDHFQNILTEEDERGNETSYTYSSDGKKLESINYPDVKLPDGTTQSATVQMAYNSIGQLTTVTSSEGFVQSYTYDGDDSHTNSYRRLIKRTRFLTTASGSSDPKIEELFDYDSIGFINSVIDGEGEETLVESSIRGWTKEITLPAVNSISPIITYRYDPDGNVIEIEHPKGSFTESGFTDDFILEKIKRDILGHPVKTELGANTNNPFIISQQNDYRGNPLKITDPNGNYQSMTYDERGLLIQSKSVGKDGSLSLFKQRYDRTNNLFRQIGGVNSDVESVRTYDAYNRIKAIEQKGEVGGAEETKSIKSFYYSWTDQIPGSSGDEFPWKDGNERIRPADISWVGDENLVILEEITEGDDPETGALLSRTFYEFDARGRMVLKRVCDFRLSYPSGGFVSILDTKFFYDEDNRLYRVEGPRGTTQAYLSDYDGIGRVIKTTDPHGNEQHYEYNGRDQVIEYKRIDKDEVAGGGATVTRIWENEYDERGRLITTIEPGSIETEFTYDDRDLLLTITDQLGIVTELEYGLLGEKKKQTLDSTGLNIVNQWSYDKAYRLIKYTDPTNQVTNYTYDGISRLLKTEIPGGAVFTRSFGTDGRLSSESAASGATLSFTYDRFGRLATMQGTSGSGGVEAVPTHTYSYDGLDRVIEATLPSGPDIERVYDGLGRLLEETNHNITLSMEYDAEQGVMKRTWSDGRVETLDLNLLGVIKKVSRTTNGTPGLGNDTTALFDNLKQHGSSLLGECELFGTLPPPPPPAGQRRVTLTGAYDNRLRLSSLLYKKTPPSGAAQDLEFIEYAYDDKSRKTQEKITNTADLNERQADHSFDDRDRLWQTIVSDPDNTATIIVSHGYEYNDADERGRYVESSDNTPFTSPTIDRSYTYTNGHRLTAAGSDSADTYTDGPIKEIGTQDYTIDALGRVIEVDGTYTITFDALGRPSIIDNGTTARKLCYFGDELWQEIIGSTVDRQYSHHPFLPDFLAIHVPGATYVPITDSRMNRLAITNNGGNIVERYRYTPFGEPFAFDTNGNSKNLSTVVIEPWFGGMRYINDVGLYLGRHRIMHPKHGIWLGLDPKGYIDSPNLYAYTAQSPIDFVDPLGLALAKNLTDPVPAIQKLKRPSRSLWNSPVKGKQTPLTRLEDYPEWFQIEYNASKLIKPKPTSIKNVKEILSITPLGAAYEQIFNNISNEDLFGLTVDEIVAAFGESKRDNVLFYLPLVISSLKQYDQLSRNSLIAAIATIAAESPMFEPTTEIGGKEYFLLGAWNSNGLKIETFYWEKGKTGNTSIQEALDLIGKGLVQVTGRNTYQEVATTMGYSKDYFLGRNSDLLVTDPFISAQSVGALFKIKGIKKWADSANSVTEWESIRTMVNGGRHGINTYNSVVNKLLKYVE